MKKGRNYAGILSLPGELGLSKTTEGYRICINPAKELAKLRSEPFSKVLNMKEEVFAPCFASLYSGEGQALEIELTFSDARQIKGKGESFIKLTVFGTLFSIDLFSREIKVGPHRIPLKEEKEHHLRIYADTDVFELYACKGLTYAVTDNESNSVSGSVKIEFSGIMGDIKLHALRGIRISE